jgi:hypothetical protein
VQIPTAKAAHSSSQSVVLAKKRQFHCRQQLFAAPPFNSVASDAFKIAGLPIDGTHAAGTSIGGAQNAGP